MFTLVADNYVIYSQIITCVMLWAVAMLFFLIIGIFTAAPNQAKPSENKDFNDIEEDFEGANDRKTFIFSKIPWSDLK